MLIGVQAAGFFLVEAEVHENPYVQARPFRVNAGSLSMYTLAPLQKTRYLSELKAGDEVLAHLATSAGRHFGVAVPDETVIER